MRVAEWATAARSWASCTEAEVSRTKPVWRTPMTSLWSPKMLRAWVARVRADTWMTPQDSSPATLYMVGIISSRPWEAVKVVVSAPDWMAPWQAAAAPASLCISTTSGMVPQMLVRPAADQSSAFSPMVDEGVMG